MTESILNFMTYEEWTERNPQVEDDGNEDCLVCDGSDYVECDYCGSEIQCDGVRELVERFQDHRAEYKKQLKNDKENAVQWSASV